MYIQQLMVTQYMDMFYKRYFNPDQDIDKKEELKLCITLIKQESDKLIEAIEKLIENENIENLCDIVKEQCDLIYMILFLANFLGISMGQPFQEVHIHSMGKTEGHKGPDGKWIKPPNYPPCNIKGVLERMGYI